MELGRGPTNDGEGLFVSADLKCFRKGMWGWWSGPTNDDEGFFVYADLFSQGGPTDYFIAMFLLSSNEG